MKKLKRSHRVRLNRSKGILITLLFSLAMAAPFLALAIPTLYAVATLPTPVLNTPDFASVFGGSDGKTLRLDPSGLIREVEFVAIPGTKFRIEESLKQGSQTIYRVTTDEYPYPTRTGYFIESRFVTTSDTIPPPRQRPLLSKQQMIDNLLAAEGSRYVWGGNFRTGIPQLLHFYLPSPESPLPPATKEMWRLAGVDCSGLLYEATNGFTPRNTSSLVEYGRSVPIEGLDPVKIVERLEPLDLIVWSGHVMIVLDRERLIESRLDPKGNGGGVVVRPLLGALLEIMKARVPQEEYQATTASGKKGFVVRRWYPAGD
jgi:hypothetical protein